MTHTHRRLLAFVFCFAPALFLMSALPVAPVGPPTSLQAVVIGGLGSDDAPAAAASCSGSPLGKGWCAKLKCSNGTCSANWKSVSSERCTKTCISPAWNCCGWRVNTNKDCRCVDGEPEPENYSCGPCDKKYLIEW